MKRYLVFGGTTYYACGGWKDFKDQYDLLSEIEAPIDQWGEECDWWQVVDTETGEIIRTVGHAQC